MRWSRIGSLIRWETNPKPEPWHWAFSCTCPRVAFPGIACPFGKGILWSAPPLALRSTEAVALCCPRTAKMSSFGVVRKRLNSNGRPQHDGACLCDSAIFGHLAGVRELHQAQGESGRLTWLRLPLRMQPSNITV